MFTPPWFNVTVADAPDKKATMTTESNLEHAGPTVSVTERAAQRIAKIVSGEPPGTSLRVSVEGGGCSGFQYKFDLAFDQSGDDLVIEKSGAKILIDPVSLQYLAGSEIDFVDDLVGAAFKVQNPNATASCGCGTSFTL